jgi:hypothetical protein
MTVQELYDETQKAGLDPRKVELFVSEGVPVEGGVPKGDVVAEVVFEEHPEEEDEGWRGAYLIEEGAIHL